MHVKEKGCNLKAKRLHPNSMCALEGLVGESTRLGGIHHSRSSGVGLVVVGHPEAQVFPSLFDLITIGGGGGDILDLEVATGNLNRIDHISVEEGSIRLRNDTTGCTAPVGDPAAGHLVEELGLLIEGLQLLAAVLGLDVDLGSLSLDRTTGRTESESTLEVRVDRIQEILEAIATVGHGLVVLQDEILVPAARLGAVLTTDLDQADRQALLAARQLQSPNDAVDGTTRSGTVASQKVERLLDDLRVGGEVLPDHRHATADAVLLHRDQGHSHAHEGANEGGLVDRLLTVLGPAAVHDAEQKVGQAVPAAIDLDVDVDANVAERAGDDVGVVLLAVAVDLMSHERQTPEFGRLQGGFALEDLAVQGTDERSLHTQAQVELTSSRKEFRLIVHDPEDVTIDLQAEIFDIQGICHL